MRLPIDLLCDVQIPAVLAGIYTRSEGMVLVQCRGLALYNCALARELAGILRRGDGTERVDVNNRGKFQAAG